ncbi:MAG: hypothetical protein U5L00_17525 [Desulfovermiculus sp.]|nr:hypothetical protein [Desulfovermiculus sp.]
METAQELKGEFLGEHEVVTPAFIDPHSHIGMVRGGEPETEAEANDRQDSLLISADALDSLQLDDVCLGEAVETGVLYSCILPGSGNIIGGRSAVIRTYALDTNLALVARAGLKAAFGYNPMSTVSWTPFPTRRKTQRQPDQQERPYKKYKDMRPLRGHRLTEAGTFL